MRPRTVALLVALSLAAGWAGSGLVSPEAPPSQAGPRRGPRPIGVTEPPAPYTEQLRKKLESKPHAPSPRRNLFVFGSRRPSPPPRRAEPEYTPPLAVPQMPIGPAFSLAGVASSVENGQTVHTAIISGNGAGGVLFAKAGDSLPGGYKVTRVEETYVQIMNGAGVEQTIRLKQ